jgi:RND family efflux transporter MFP subunit
MKNDNRGAVLPAFVAEGLNELRSFCGGGRHFLALCRVIILVTKTTEDEFQDHNADPAYMSPDKQTLDQLKIKRPTTQPRGNVAGRLGGVVLLLAVVAAAIWFFMQPKAVEIRTATALAAKTEGPRTLLNASGYVTARRQATVSSKATGRVLDVLVEEGLKVEEGQVLAHIDASNVEANLALARAQLESARSALGETKASLELAEKALTRTQKIADVQGVSIADVDRAFADAAMLRARLARLEADLNVANGQIEIWKQQLDDTIIRAPFSGVVISKNAQPGEMISPMSSGGFTRTGICTLVDMSSLEVEVDVNESYINRVTAGQPVVVTLDSYPDWRIPSKVIAIIPTADRQKATVRVRVGFEALDPRILPDMGLKVAFQGAAEAQAKPVHFITVPKSAVRRIDGRDIVWIVRGDQLERRAVTVDTALGDQISLAAGLDGGERVVVEGPENLNEGSKVTEKKS